MKWFPADWLADSELAKTSLLGRGLWIEALNAMFNSDTFTLSGTPCELARVLRCSVAELNTALDELAKANAACHSTRNGVVTLLSRRLEREYKAREHSRLRQQRFRNKPPCHTNVPSAYAYASESPGNGGAGERGDRPVELPRGFPASVDDAIRLAGTCGADPAFIAALWNSAMAQGGVAGNGRPITSWCHYVSKHWPREQEKRAQSRQAPKTIGDTMARDPLGEVKKTLRQLERLENEPRH